ncbi:helix-turn-helix domain-containing protein [Gordonia sp. NPDC003422]
MEQVMVMASADQVVLTDEDRAVLQARVRAATTPQREMLRALIVLLAADGQPTAAIAAEVGICTDTARKWRARFCRRGLAGLVDAPRAGRPPIYTPADKARVTAWAGQLPAEHNLPLSRWSSTELANQLTADGIRGLGVVGAAMAGR